MIEKRQLFTTITMFRSTSLGMAQTVTSQIKGYGLRNFDFINLILPLEWGTWQFIQLCFTSSGRSRVGGRHPSPKRLPTSGKLKI